VLIGHPERAKARGVAQEMAEALTATGLADTIGSQATASQFRQIGATYFPHRHGLLGAEDRELLETGHAQEIAKRALAQTYGVGFADGDLLRNDPFLLFPRFLMGLPAMTSRLTMASMPSDGWQYDLGWDYRLPGAYKRCAIHFLAQ
jgi:predicted exporter